jgi:hypothetical protein
MRTGIVMGVIGGAIVGYIGWLVAISIGGAFTTVSLWSLIVLAVSVLLAIWGALWGSRLRSRRNYPLAAFAVTLPILPLLLTLGVLVYIYL